MLENSLPCSQGFLANFHIFLLSQLKPSISKTQFDLESEGQGLLRASASKDRAMLEIDPKFKSLKLCQNKAYYMPDSLV